LLLCQVDLFFYREPEETEKPAAEDAAGESTQDRGRGNGGEGTQFLGGGVHEHKGAGAASFKRMRSPQMQQASWHRIGGGPA
jgi:hypothetical protein